jgi:polyisoprenyl-phosphate glycosyltransferase
MSHATADRQRPAAPFVTVIVPVYNEEECLPRLVAELERVLQGFRREYLLVHGGCTDATAAVIARLKAEGAPVSNLELSRRCDQQVAIKAGIDHARGDVAVIMDADLQHPPAELPGMLDAWRGGMDVVAMIKRNHPGRPLFSRMAAALFYRLFNLLSDVRIEPEGSDFRLLDRTAIDALRAHHETQPFIRGLIGLVGFRTTTLSYDVAVRAAGASHYPLRRLWRLALYGIYGFSTAPLRLAIWLAVLLLLGSCGYTLVSYVTGYGLGNLLPGATDKMVLGMLMVALNCVVLGILGIHGIYLARILAESRRRPLYSIRIYDPCA